MKKSKAMVRILTLLLAFALVFTACSGGSGTQTTGDTSTSVSSNAQSDTGTVTDAASKELVTLQVFAMTSNTSGLQEGWWCDILRDELGIQLDLIPAGDQSEQKLQALMAGGDLPDVVVFKEDKFVLDAMRAGLLVAYDDYIDQLPNVVENMSKAMKYYADAVSDDGKCYALPYGTGITPTVERFGYGPMLRWDLYKKLDYPEVKTLFDYIPLLKQMVELEPVNADGQETYGITLWSDWDSIYMNLAGFFSSIVGVSEGRPNIPMCEVDYNTMQLRSMLDPDSAYIMGLRFLYEANQAGILDPASMTQRYESANEKFNSGRVMFSNWWWACDGYRTPERLNAADFKGFMEIPFTDGYSPVVYENNPTGRGWSWSISSSSKHIDRALSYVNFLADPDTTMIFENGPQGYLWDLDDSGTPYTTDFGYEFRLDVEAKMPGGNTLSSARDTFGGTSSLLGIGNISKTYGVGAEWRLWPGYQKTMTELDKDYLAQTGYPDHVARTLAEGKITNFPLASNLLAPLPDDIQMIATRVGDIVKTDSWLIVFAANEAEYQQLYSKMVSNAETQGLAELTEYGKKAWSNAVAMASQYE